MLDARPTDADSPIRRTVAPISACPVCRSSLDWCDSSAVCTEPGCGRSFRIAGGIPVLADEAAAPVAFQPSAPPANANRLKALALRRLPSLDLNVVPEAVRQRLVREVLARGARPVVLNVGGKHPTSITEDLCARPDVQAIECDLAWRKRTRILADPARLPLGDGTVDAVLLDGLLEHVPDAEAVVREAVRVLKPGGILYADTPFMLQVHGGAFDYARLSHQAQRWLFRDFEELESGVSSGPGVALAYAIQYFLLCFPRSAAGRYGVKTFCRLAFFWLKYVDLLIARRPAALDAAHGLYFLGRKADAPLTQRDLVARYAGAVPHLYKPANKD